MLSRVDHLVYATPNLKEGIAEVESLLGIRPTPGGRHPGFGTRNALLALGDRCYLEIIGPDPERDHPGLPEVFGIAQLTASRLVTWAANSESLEGLADAEVAEGIHIGALSAGSRQTPEGVVLSWRFTDPLTVIADGLVPFFIDWGNTSHPASTAAQGARLVDLRAEHPDAVGVSRIFGVLGLNLKASQAPNPSLVAWIQSPRGEVELR